MSKVLFLICFFCAIILETAIIQIPFVLLLILVATIVYKSEWMFIFGVLLGIIIDALSFRHLGQTSLFYTVFLLFVFMYEQKFELRTVAFAALMSFIGGFFYFLIFGSQVLLFQLTETTILGMVLFLIFDRFFKKQNRNFTTSA
jgi:cell shape-determining protein MreD